MKEYPSISASRGTKFVEIPNAYLFDKLDGRQVRAEWSKKRGWHKWGTRHHLVDESDLCYGRAIQMFKGSMADVIEGIARGQRWESVTAYLELWQPRTATSSGSLGGIFDPANLEFHLTLFDIEPYKKCILGPREFLDLFGDSGFTPKCLGNANWTRGLVEDVFQGKVPGVTFEGVVVKSGTRHAQMRAKAKTQAWIDAIVERFGAIEGSVLINS